MLELVHEQARDPVRANPAGAKWHVRKSKGAIVREALKEYCDRHRVPKE